MSEITSCCVSDDCCGEASIIGKVKDYYGKQLQSKDDLKTASCCAIDRPPVEIRAILPLIADEIHNMSRIFAGSWQKQCGLILGIPI